MHRHIVNEPHKPIDHSRSTSKHVFLNSMSRPSMLRRGQSDSRWARVRERRLFWGRTSAFHNRHRHRRAAWKVLQFSTDTPFGSTDTVYSIAFFFFFKYIFFVHFSSCLKHISVTICNRCSIYCQLVHHSISCFVEKLHRLVRMLCYQNTEVAPLIVCRVKLNHRMNSLWNMSVYVYVNQQIKRKCCNIQFGWYFKVKVDSSLCYIMKIMFTLVALLRTWYLLHNLFCLFCFVGLLVLTIEQRMTVLWFGYY